MTVHFWLSLHVLLFVLGTSTRAYTALPKPFELSFSDDPQEPCRHPALKRPQRIMNSTISLCFGDVEEAGAENRLDWRVMFTSFRLDNKTLLLDLKIRRVLIFAPGASFTMAGSRPVSVFSRIKELEIGTHYNGYGKVSDPSNSSVIFQGQLNTTVFEGQFVYQTLNRSHSFHCFHNNSLQPAFYRDDQCLACAFATYDTQHSPSSSVGWRASGNPLCDDNSSTELGNDKFKTQTHVSMPDTNVESRHEDRFGFPPTGFADYNRDTPDPSPSRTGTGLSTSLAGHADEKIDDQTSTNSTIAYSTTGSKTSSENDEENVTNLDASNNKDIKGRRAILDTHGSPSFTNQKSKRSRRPCSSEQNGPRCRRGHRDNGATVRILRAENAGGRTKRSTRWPQPAQSSSNQSFTETISCSLHLVADHLFFNEMGEKSPAKTVNLMLSVIIGADAVFRATDFDGDGVRDNIGFMVKNITIIHNSSVAFYRYSRGNGDSFQYLKSFSTGDFSDVCLGVAFTAIDFQRGVVGLAWYASSVTGGAGKGGICGQRVYLPNEGSSFSFNTAIVSFINHGNSVSMEKAILTMAHEFGHCFGSSHDDMAGSQCNKDYPQGSYLMQKYRPAEYFPNNYKFSPCSLRAMYPVIALKGRCLTRYMGPTCGNAVVEEGEECDCGLSGTCQFNDPCCTPGDAPRSGADHPCTVRRSLGLECSPVTFSCCSDSCKHISLAERYVCREAGDCYSRASCDGRGPLCPASTLHPDGTPCHGGIRACTRGHCRQSLCVQHGLRDCFCQERSEDRCKLCCQSYDDPRCRPAHIFNITTTTGYVLYLPQGDGCLNYRGICTLPPDSSSRDQTFCVTDGLDGEFSALRGLQADGRTKGVTSLSDSWFLFLFVPFLMAVLVAVFASSRGVCCRLQRPNKEDSAAGTDSKLLAFIVAAQSRSQIFQQEVEKASALCDKMCSHVVLQRQRQLKLLQQGGPDRSPHYVQHQNLVESPHDVYYQNLVRNPQDIYHQSLVGSPHGIHHHHQILVRNPHGINHQNLVRNPHGIHHQNLVRNPHGIHQQSLVRNPHEIHQQNLVRSPHGIHHQNLVRSPQGIHHQNFSRSPHGIHHQNLNRSHHGIHHQNLSRSHHGIYNQNLVRSPQDIHQRTSYNNDNRTLIRRSFPWHNHGTGWSPRTAGSVRTPRNFNTALSLSGSSSTLISDMSSAASYERQHHCKAVAVPRRYGHCQNSVTQTSDVYNYKKQTDYIRQTLRPSRRKLRATYSKPAIKTPLRGRRTLRDENPLTQSTRRRPIRNTKGNTTGRGRYYFDTNADVLSNFNPLTPAPYPPTSSIVNDANIAKS